MKRVTDQARTGRERIKEADTEATGVDGNPPSANEELVAADWGQDAKAGAAGGLTVDLDELLRSSEAAMLLLDGALRVRHFTPACGRLARVTPSDVNRPMSDLAWELDDPALAADCAALLQGARIEDVEVSDHAGRWYLRRIRPYRGHGAGSPGVVVTLTDITGLKEAETRLRERNRMLEWQAGLISHAAPVLGRDLEGRVSFWNPAAQALYGWTAREALGQVSHELLRTHFPEPMDRILAQVRESGAWRGELVHTCADGREVTVDSQWSLCRDGAGTARSIVEVNADISERKRLERDLRDKARQLDTILQNASVGIAFMEHRTITWANPRACEIVGYRMEEIVGQTTRLFYPSDEVYEDIGRKAMPRVMSGETHSHEVRILRKGGEPVWLRVTSRAVDPDAVPLQAISIVEDITEHKHLQALAEEYRQALEARVAERTAELEQVYRQVQATQRSMERAGFAVLWSVASTGRFVFANRRAAEMLGYGEDELLTMAVSDIDPSFSPERLQGVVRAMLEQGSLRFETVARHKDGHSIPVEVTVCPLEGQESGKLTVVSIVTDITERTRTEQELERHRRDLKELVAARTAELADTVARLESATKAAGLGVWVWDMAQDSVVWDARTCDIFGVPEAERGRPLTYSDWLGRVHPEDRALVEERVEAASGEAGDYWTDYRIVLPDGGTRHVLATAVIEGDGGGEPRRTVGFVRDITERKRAEQALAAEQERFRRFFEDNGSVMVLIDPDSGRIEAANSAAAQFYGYPVARLVGMSIGDINTLPPDELAGRVQEIRANRLSTFQAPHRLASGEVRQVRIYSSPIKVGDRALLFSIIHDETARFKAASELLRAKEAAEAAARAKGEFLAHMSHEIRTPMNGILGLAELALHRPLEPVAREYLEKLHRSGRHLLGILNDILDQSRIEAGQLKLRSAPFAVDDLLGALRDLFGAVAEQEGLDLHVEAADDVPRHLLGDALRLRQVLANLLGNALKFTERGNVRLQVSCLGVQDGIARLRWAVSDTGPGLDEAAQARLFAPFSRGDQSISRGHGGTGLGLSISRGLVEMMGGLLTLQSTPGAGSTFAVELSLTVTAAPPLRSPQPRGPVDLRGARVLVAEDQPLNREVIADMLALLGVDTSLVATGREALDALSREAFDLVLMDIQMPDMDGLTATTRLREDPARAKLPVIAITAGVTEAERAKAAAVGMNDLLAKPVSLMMLADTLGRWLPARGADRGEPRDGDESRPGTRVAGTLPPLSGFDPRRLRKTLVHGRGREFLRLFTGSATEDVDEVDGAIDAGDEVRARRALHRLRGACAFVGAVALEQSAERVSDAIKQGQPTDAPLAALRQALGDAVAQIETLPG